MLSRKLTHFHLSTATGITFGFFNDFQVNVCLELEFLWTFVTHRFTETGGNDGISGTSG